MNHSLKLKSHLLNSSSSHVIGPDDTFFMKFLSIPSPLNSYSSSHIASLNDVLFNVHHFEFSRPIDALYREIHCDSVGSILARVISLASA